MFSQSITAYLLTSLIAILKNKFENSLLVNSLYKLMDCLSKHAAESKFCAWAHKDVFTERYYETSLFYGAFNAVLRFVFKIIRNIQGWVRGIFKNSLTLYLYDKVVGLKWFTVDRILALFIGFMFIVPHDFWNNLYAFLAAVFFAFWIFMNIASGKLKGKNGKAINVTIVGFFVAICVSTVTAIKFSDAFRIGLFMIASLLLAYSVYASVDTKEKLISFLKIVLGAVTITAVIGIVQRFMGVEVDPEYVDMATNAGMPGRVFSTFANPNNFAELLLLFMPFFVPLFLSVKERRAKLGVAGCFIIVLVALAMTYSRSCWVGFALAAVLFVLMYDKRLIVPLIIVVLVAIPLLPETIMNRIFTIGSMKDTSNSYRLYIWESCWRMVKHYGSVGLGLGPASFKSVYMNYADQAALTAPHSHMLYMELIIEMGILGFVSFMGYIYSVIKKTASAMKNMDNTLKAVAIAGFSALLGIAFVCCAEYIWFYPRVMFAFWIVPGLLLATARIAKKGE